MSKQSVIIDGVRSPIGMKNGALVGTRPDDIAAQIVSGLMRRNSAVSADEVEDLVMGCAFPEGPQGMLIGRSVGILAGLSVNTGGKVVNRFCGSSMDALHQVSTAIEAEDIEVGIAAGVEDMFSVPMGGFAPDFHPDLAEQEFYIGMGETAENLASEGSISRDRQEEFSIQSHEKALKAQNDGKFENEIIPIEIADGSSIVKDEGPRTPDVEKIKSLAPAFIEDGTVTAATSSPISVGSSALLVTNEEYAHKHNLKIRSKIISRSIAGVDWKQMGMGPIPASEKALKKAGLSFDELDAIELNEAFAAQSLFVIQEGNFPVEKINLNGGAIALGHPLGCSGARIITTLLNVLEQIDGQFGLATMCIGTGQGIATVIERVKN